MPVPVAYMICGFLFNAVYKLEAGIIEQLNRVGQDIEIPIL
jgi:hypothetical protein